VESLEETFDALHGAGFSAPPREMVALTDEPKIPGFVCSPNQNGRDRAAAVEFAGIGFDLDPALSRVKSVAELLERLCLYCAPEEFARHERYRPGEGFAGPALFRCQSSQQIPDVAGWEREVRLAAYKWHPARELTSGQEAWVPAQCVYLVRRFEDEPRLRPELISTGAALGRAGSGAALRSGLFECIERDAYIASYLRKQPLARIVDLPPGLQDLVEYLERYLLSPHILDATSDLGVPSVIVLTVDETGLGPAVDTGLCAAEDYETAIRKALLESLQARRTGRVNQHLQQPEKFPNEDEVHTIDDRYRYWFPLDRLPCLRFWLEAPRTVAFHEIADKAAVTLDGVLDRLAGKGFHVFVADVTLPEVREAGFEAVKVIVPELHPLYLNEQAKALYSVHYGEIRPDPDLKPHPFI